MEKLLRQMFGAMPREVATPQRRTVASFDRFVEVLDAHNGKTDCFVSVHHFADRDPEEASYKRAVVNKTVFDFDGAWEELVRAYRWLDERGAAHFATFSGSDRSGHLWVLCEPTTHQQSLEYFQRDVLIDGIGLRKHSLCGHRVRRKEPGRTADWYCDRCDRALPEQQTQPVVDTNLVGDITTCIRVPNTVNPGAGRLCIPLKPEEVTPDWRAVHELAEPDGSGRFRQRDLLLADIVSGSSPVDITQHRERAEQYYRAYTEEREFPGLSDAEVLSSFEPEIGPEEMMESLDCRCVGRMVTGPDGEPTGPRLGHRDRRVLVSYLIEEGFNPAEINRFLLAYVAEDKAIHSIEDEEQAVRIWRDGVKAPSKSSLKRMGLFRQDCPVHSRAARSVMSS